jgi:hypothetical protein
MSITGRTLSIARASAGNPAEAMRLEATVLLQRRAVADARRELELHDDAVEKAMAARPKSATQTKSEGDKRRVLLAEKLEKATKHLGDLESQRAQATVQERQIAVHRNAESAPLAYLARRLGFDASDPDQVFGWQAAAIVLCADPFALLLIWAVASVKRRRRT